jgi:hypothetical protein
MTDDVTRIAMWSGPRNISTAMMRSFENRSDTQVIDEPFYAHYLFETGIEHPGRDAVLAGQSTDDKHVAETLLAPLQNGKKIFYQKHMSHHQLMGMDQGWMDRVTHAFLIRDPRATLASYVKAREEVSLSDLGLPQQLALFDQMADRLGEAPPVIDSADLRKDPETKLTALCDALDIPFDTAMLSWPAGKRDTDGVWAPWWYNEVEASTGFKPYKYKKPDIADHLESIADLAVPYYEKLSRYCL